MNKHTPGPWEAFTEPEFSGWWAVRQITDDGVNHEVGSGDGGLEEADAHLMAAAPELLHAVQTLLVAIEPYLSSGSHGVDEAYMHVVAIPRAKEALKKAKGEQQ